MRPARPEDLPALRALARAGLVHDPDAEAVVDLLWSAAADGCRIVRDDSTGIIGFAPGSLRPARDGVPATGPVDLLVVHPGHPERGPGRALPPAPEQRLIRAGPQRLRVR